MALVLGIVFTSSSVLAENGKAFIPFWQCWHNTTTGYRDTDFWITNITPNSIIVTVTLYSKDNTSGSPTIFSDNNVLGVYNASTYELDPTVGSVEITIAPYESSRLNIYSASTYSRIWGYGSIEWEQPDNVGTGLLVYGQTSYFDTNFYGKTEITINNGQPF